MLSYFKDFAVAQVDATGYNAAATAVTMSAGEGAKLPAAPFVAIWWNATDYATPDLDPNREVILVGTRVADGLSNITRGYGDDAASTKNTAGKTYKLLATISAKELDARSKTIAALGPSANLTNSSGVEIDVSSMAVTLPANFLKAGDFIDWLIAWQHTAGAYTSAPRIGFRWGGGYLFPIAAHWSSTELGFSMRGTIMVRDAGSTGAANVQAVGQRENGTMIGSAGVATHGVDTTAAVTFTPSYRMDVAGETIIMARLHMVHHRP